MDAPQSLAQIDWSDLTQQHTYHPSPAAWEDHVLYFLLVDRFSDGREAGGHRTNAGKRISARAVRSTPLFNAKNDAGNADRDAWLEAGRSWCGGTLAGAKQKLGYLRRLGVGALWLSPIFKQVTGSGDYHGYGVQNFLDVDPHFGTREDLRAFVEAAHAENIYVILDILLNHAGDVFAYQGGARGYDDGRLFSVRGYRTQKSDDGSLPFGALEPERGAWPDGAVWPRELQPETTWTRKGEIRDWDAFPQFAEGDFLSLKDIDHGSALEDPSASWDQLRRIESFRPSATLFHLIQIYKYWIAYADVDGFRIDTVKHMEPGAVRIFANAIHEFAQSLGKERFYLIGEVTGGRASAVSTVRTTGIDAALGIDEIPDKLEYLAKGKRSPGDPRTSEQEGYFDLFRNSLFEGESSHQWFIKHVVTSLDDHDQVGAQRKFRFCGRDDGLQVLPIALALNLFTAGIPCLYYGTEQGFDGADPREGDDTSYSDVFLRECMFGGPFGSHQSRDRHFFDESHPVYSFVARACELRSARTSVPLRRGRQYLREVSASGEPDDFHYPQALGGNLLWAVAWSRIFADQEMLCAVHTDRVQPLTVWITVDHALHPPGSILECLFASNPTDVGKKAVVEARNGSAIRITLPPAGCAVYG